MLVRVDADAHAAAIVFLTGNGDALDDNNDHHDMKRMALLMLIGSCCNYYSLLQQLFVMNPQSSKMHLEVPSMTCNMGQMFIINARTLSQRRMEIQQNASLVKMVEAGLEIISLALVSC